MFKGIVEMILSLGDFLHKHHDNLLPTGLIGTGITIGYTKLVHLPLMTIFTDPNIVSLIRDYLSIISIISGLSLFVINNIIKPFLKKKKSKESLNDNIQTESNHDPK